MATDIRDKTVGQIVKELPQRVVAMVSKLVGVKGVILALATWMTYQGQLETWGFVLIALFVVVGREIFKYISDLRR